MKDEFGRQRVVIEGVRPEIDGGRFPIKRTIGEDVVVEADVFADGHDVITVLLQYRHEATVKWSRPPNDVFSTTTVGAASFPVTGLGRWCYAITGWVDHFATWRRGLLKKLEAKQNVQVDLLIGAKFIEDASRRATTEERHTLATWGKTLASGDTPEARAHSVGLECGARNGYGEISGSTRCVDL
jgi:starch synthase (maltosyl-transferring)